MTRWLPLLALIGAFTCVAPSVHACVGPCEGTCSSGTLTIATNSFLHPSYIASEPAISAPTLVALMTAGAPVFLADCRNASCLTGPRIPGALVVNLDGDPAAILKSFPAKQMMIILYDGCDCGCRRLLRKRLVAEGYVNLIDYPGGIRDWIAAGRAGVETQPDDIIPHDISIKAASGAASVGRDPRSD
ncbi:MAG TPA: rhodanese-like domain-containing protein [Candidatus Ozemobacteraceae bacterium]